MNPNLRILMVEDVPADAELIERQLRKDELSFSSRRVETREAFIREIKAFSPDLILSDYTLPLFDGMAALTLAKELCPEVPFIIVTGSLNEETAVECIKAGAMDYVIKENLVRIGPAVRGALEKKQTLEEKQKAEAALLRQTEELARSNKELEQFAAVAAHDLQEPLRKIITFADRLVEHSAPTLDETSRNYLHRMHHSALRMRELVEGLFQYAITAKVESLEEVNLKTIVDEVLLDLELVLVKADAVVRVGALPSLKADPIQMRQLFQNLIMNAVNFCRADVPPRVDIQSRDLGNDFVEITVEDNGIGFDEKYLDRIFMPFQRLHGKESLEGIGIGLTICHRIVQRHGGHITAKSAMGKGSTFIITLPLRLEEEGN